MVSRIRIGPEGGPFVEIDEDNGTLKLESPSGDIDLQSNKLINALSGNLDLTNSELQNAVLLGATLGGALNADGQDINNVGSLGANQVGTAGSPVDVESQDIDNADTVTTQDLVVNGTATGPFGGFDISSGYVDETSNRSLNTTFTNNKGPIYVSVRVGEGTGNRASHVLKVDGLGVNRYRDESGTVDISLTGFVPSGSTYLVKTFTGGSLVKFFELELT